MKKFLAMALVLVFGMLVLSGCNGATDSTESPSDSGNASVELTVFEQFENALIEKNLTFEKVTMAAELIGAEQGVKYKLQDENVEIYRFDPSSDAYLEAEKTQSLKMEGFGAFEATVVNGYAINSDNLELINIFKDIVSK